MLPKGLFGIVSSVAIDYDELRRSLNALLDEDEYYESQSNTACTGIVGVICSSRYPYVKCISTSPDHSQIGAIDGSSFHGSRLDTKPHRLLDRDLALPDEANGMFAAAAWNGERLKLLVDPLASTPLYYRWDERCFAFSSSLATLLAIDIFAAPAHSERSLAQYLCWGKVLGGGTLYHGVHKMQAAEFVDFAFSDHNPTKKKYWRPRIQTNGDGAALNRTVDAFAASVDSVMRTLPAPIAVSLSGGYDSRTILAVLLAGKKPFVSVTHGMADGFDTRIAQSLAKEHGLDHRMLWIDGAFSESYPLYAKECVLRSNGMMSLENAHLPFVYAAHTAYAHSIVDGISTFLERNFGLRRRAKDGSSKDEFFNAVWDYLIGDRERTVAKLENGEKVIQIAKEDLYNLLPACVDLSDPEALADTFYLEQIIANHATDGVCLQQHYNRFMTPYYELGYINELSKLSARKRSANIPQRAIMKRFTPSLRWRARSYSDIRTLPVSQFHMQLLPVAFDRLLHRITPPPPLDSATVAQVFA